jgi:beta-lactamase superfamily II metal-dependent hydrolase
MRRAKLWPLALVALALVVLPGCSEKEMNPFDPQQDPDPPIVTSFAYADGEAEWTTDEDALCVLEYGPVGGPYDRYTYESTKDHATSHRVKLLGMEAGEDYEVRIRSRDRAGNEAYEIDVALPPTITGAAFTGDTMTLSMIDVGWGLSMVLTTPAGEHVIIDAGSSEHLNDVVDFLTEHGIDQFAAAAVTHHHSDHYGGYIEVTEGDVTTPGVLDLFWVGTMIFPDETYMLDPASSYLLDEIDQHGIPIAYATQGDSSDDSPALQWDASPGFSVQVLSAGMGTQMVPPAQQAGLEFNGNNDSIVFKFRFHDVSYITMADGEYYVEHSAVDAFGRAGVRADLLQVAHHANDDATSAFWLDNVSPRVGLISNAMIEAPLEKEVVLNGLRTADADYFVTDRIFPNTPRDADPTYGHLLARTDGETIEVTIEEQPW